MAPRILGQLHEDRVAGERLVRLERADERAADEDLRGRAAADDAAARREPVGDRKTLGMWECDRFRVRHRGLYLVDKCVVDSEILHTDPDGVAFSYRFEDLKVDGDFLVVTSKTADPLWRESISKLAQ